MTTQTANKGVPGQGHAPGGQQAPQVAAYPFPVGVYDVEAQDGGLFQVTQTTSPQQLPIYNVTPDGWLRGIWCDWSWAWASGNAGAVSYSKDNPFSGINKVTLRDLGQQAVIGPIGGYDWMTLNKFGGYQDVEDPRADLTYSASTGTGAGSITFSLYLPFEFVSRDSLGVVDNTSKPGWTVEFWVDSIANTFNVIPTVAPTVQLACYPMGYTKPVSAAPNGRPFSQRPPKSGTLQYWVSEGGQGAFNGAFTYDLVNGIAFPLRNWIYKILDNSNGTRVTGDTEWPNPATLQYGNVIMRAISKNRWNSQIGRENGLTNTTPDAALGRENGIYPVQRITDFSNHAGDELRYQYLNTQQGTLVRLSGSTTGAALLYVLVNYIKPVDKNYYGLIGG